MLANLSLLLLEGKCVSTCENDHIEHDEAHQQYKCAHIRLKRHATGVPQPLVLSHHLTNPTFLRRQVDQTSPHQEVVSLTRTPMHMEFSSLWGRLLNLKNAWTPPKREKPAMMMTMMMNVSYSVHKVNYNTAAKVIIGVKEC